MKVSPWPGNPAVFETDKSDKPPFIADGKKAYEFGRRVRAKQFRTLMSVDDVVKKVLTRLGELGEGRETLVIYISDNGVSWAEHGIRGKNVPYRVVSHIPLFLKWRGHVIPGDKDTRLAANVDIAPTLADAADLEDQIEHTMDGRSLLDTSWDRDRLLLESWVPDWASTLGETYQYTEYYDESGQLLEFDEYYDLVEDPWQLENLLRDEDPLSGPTDLLMLKSQLAADRSCEGDECP